MTPKQFKKFLDRDRGCLHCGDDTTAVPHHRMNRGMGGSKARDGAANVIVMCSVMNGLMESDSMIAKKAKEWGWKLESWQESDKVPVWHCMDQRWYLLDNSWKRSIV